MYINEISDCDSCDVRSETAVMETLSGEVFCICKSCLEDILSEFGNDDKLLDNDVINKIRNSKSNGEARRIIIKNK